MKKGSRKTVAGPERSEKRASPPAVSDEMRGHYEFRGGERGKYAVRYREGTNVVVLEPDVAARFPDAAAVNRALRALAQVADDAAAPRRRSRRRSA